MKKLDFADVERAVDWGLTASFLEEKTCASSLAAICQAGCDRRGFDARLESMARWAVDTGARIKMFEGHSPLLFQLAAFPGAAKAWQLLLDAGYDGSGRMVVKKPGSDQGRTASKLGLLCCAPYCWGPELAELIALLIAQGADPNERDSEGWAPLGRLNEEVKKCEAASSDFPDARASLLIRAAQALLTGGAAPESLLPSLEFFAAKGIRACLSAKIESAQLLEELLVDPAQDLGRSPKSL